MSSELEENEEIVIETPMWKLVLGWFWLIMFILAVIGLLILYFLDKFKVPRENTEKYRLENKRKR